MLRCRHQPLESLRMIDRYGHPDSTTHAVPDKRKGVVTQFTHQGHGIFSKLFQVITLLCVFALAATAALHDDDAIFVFEDSADRLPVVPGCGVTMMQQDRCALTGSVIPESRVVDGDKRHYLAFLSPSLSWE